MLRVLFVCTGNICRSPTAEGVFRHKAAAAGLDAEAGSCGLAGYHVGDPPDPRARRAARERGYDIAGIRARQIRSTDFAEFDLLLAMDRSHLRQLERLAPLGVPTRVELFMSRTGTPAADVPDPYYGGPADFEHALDLIEAGVDALLADVRAP